MKVDARWATEEDLDTLVELYRTLEAEMVELHPMWPIADGLDEPVRASLTQALTDPNTVMLIGTVDEYPFGFLLARVEPMLAQAEGETVGAIRLIFVDHDAREVAIGEAMRELAMAVLREKGISKFDAHVLPGHRLAKNFFEAGGFSARSIVMHHDDDND